MTAPDPQVTTREQWVVARRELLAQEKELTRHRDRVNAARRALPMVEITEQYVFDGPRGRSGLGDLFDGRSQLLIYHFMFEPDADEGCPSCSFTMDNVGDLHHLYARDTSFAVVSHAPLHKLEHYRQRMGWTFPGTPRRAATSTTTSMSPSTRRSPRSNTTTETRPNSSAWTPPGKAGPVKSTVSAHSSVRVSASSTPTPATRAPPNPLGTYHWLDLTARGRQEDWEPQPRRGDDPFMSWLRRHDEYEPT